MTSRSPTPAPILAVSDLKTQFRTDDGLVKAVDGVSFTVGEGEVLGLVGESGSGKTITALSILQLVASPGEIVAGEVVFEGRNLIGLSRRELTALRGDRISMIFQQPRICLNPVLTIGAQISELFVKHRGMSETAAQAEAFRLLDTVGIPSAREKAKAYPHELSGGQAQRVMIAIALALRPRLLIADEPTTALDVTIQAQILNLLRELCGDLGTALILVTHDLGVIAQLADRVAVMYAGQIVEQASAIELFKNPLHPYTQGLLASMPMLGKLENRLAAIPGSVPSAYALPTGCRFAPRCAPRVTHRLERCEREPPPLAIVEPSRCSRCWLQAETPPAEATP